MTSDHAYGISDSLYDRNQVTRRKNGDPIADCFGIISRPDSAILAVADGVNWGEKASVAAKSAIHGSLHYLSRTLYGETRSFDRAFADESSVPNRVGNTRDVFVALLRAFSCAHDLILANEGMLTTLTVAVVLPLKRRGDEMSRYVCCVCNVGDTLAYVFSPRWGVRELTKGSHDINCNRDMRDALGALGPVDGINPELSNLTLSVTTLTKGDIVVVASDGLTDNFDPNVCRFTVNSRLGVETQRIKAPLVKPMTDRTPIKPPRKSHASSSRPEQKDRAHKTEETKSSKEPDQRKHNRPTVAETRTSSLRRQISTETPSNTQTHKLLRSKTMLEGAKPPIVEHIVRNEDGIPYVTPVQRYELQLLLIEDVLRNGISGKDEPCKTARKLCENLVNFTVSITSAKRHTLEDSDLYFDNRDGVSVEVTQQEKKIRRKRALEKVQSLPGKLDHVTVVAWNVGNV